MFKHLEMARIRMFIKDVIAKYSGSNILYSSGTVVKPTLSYNSGTRELTVGQGTYRTFLTTDFSGVIKEYTVPQTILTLLDNTRYYICATYNNGSPIVYAETNISVANDSDVLVIYTIFTEGTELDVLDWGKEAISLANRLNERLIDTNRFGIVGGFGLSASSRVVTVAGGEFYLGSNKIAYNSISSDVNELELIWRNGSGGFNEQDVTLYPNTQYDNGSGTLATLTDTHYGIVWVWRSAGNPIEMYGMLGDQSYPNLELAKGGKTPPDLPDKISLGAFLVGRIIFQKGSSTAIVESAFDTVFNANSPTQHNGLLGLQGSGVAGEYNHLNNAQYTVVQNTSGINTGDETNSSIISKLGYTPESVLNKAINLTTSNNTLYPTVKAVNDAFSAFTIAHNSTTSKQGGTTDEYYHLTNAQLTTLSNISEKVLNSSKLTAYEANVDNHSATQINTYQKLTIALTLNNKTSDFTLDAINNRIVYTGATTKLFTFNATATLLNAGTNNISISFIIYKNGLTAQTQTKSTSKLSQSTDKTTINAASAILLNTNDFIEIWASCDKIATYSTEATQLQFHEDLRYSLTGV